MSSLVVLYICLVHNILLLFSCEAVFDCFAIPWTSFSVHGISQARILEWGAISYSRGTKPLSLLLQVNSLPLNHVFRCLLNECVNQWIRLRVEWKFWMFSLLFRGMKLQKSCSLMWLLMLLMTVVVKTTVGKCVDFLKSRLNFQKSTVRT